MLKLLLIGVAVLAALVAALFFYASTKPDTLRFSRSTLIEAQPQKIYVLIEDFHRWTEWSPYEHRDPNMKRTFGGAEKGEGATYAWEGNSDIGSGRMEIIEATSPSRILIQLDFISPMEAHNIAVFTMEPEGEATLVTWTMEGEANIFSKVAGIFIDMDKMVGTDFEAGLAKLKSRAEEM
ncbi:MAG: SRPBCC family protein [Parvibaculum sp.]